MLGQSSVEKIGTRISEKYPDDHYALVSGQWLLFVPGTTTTVSKELGITDDSTGSALVLSFTSYFGKANPQIWEWITSKAGTKGG